MIAHCECIALSVNLKENTAWMQLFRATFICLKNNRGLFKNLEHVKEVVLTALSGSHRTLQVVTTVVRGTAKA